VQALGLCAHCAFLHNVAPLDNTVILTEKCGLVKGVSTALDFWR
jgi:hypothetical protein